MARSRYVITEPNRPHFLTCTVVEWLPVFTRPQAVQILFDTWSWLRSHEGMRLYGYVVMENHLHFIAQAERLNRCVSRFKSFTARKIIDHLEQQHTDDLLSRLQFAKRLHKADRQYQFWQEGTHAELIFSEGMMRQKLDYIHANPVRRGYVDRAEHWRYSSAGQYSGQGGLIEIDPW